MIIDRLSIRQPRTIKIRRMHEHHGHERRQAAARSSAAAACGTPARAMKLVQQLGAEQDQEDHAGGLAPSRAGRRRSAAPVEPAASAAVEPTQEDADRGGRVGVVDAGVDAADDDGEDDQHRHDRDAWRAPTRPADRARPPGPRRAQRARRSRTVSAKNMVASSPGISAAANMRDDVRLDDDRVDDRAPPRAGSGCRACRRRRACRSRAPANSRSGAAPAARPGPSSRPSPSTTRRPRRSRAQATTAAIAIPPRKRPT